MRWSYVALLIGLLSTPAAPLAAQADAPTPSRLHSGSPPASGSYQVGPEDVIEVFVWKEPELSTTVTIRPDGMIMQNWFDELRRLAPSRHQ